MTGDTRVWSVSFEKETDRKRLLFNDLFPHGGERPFLQKSTCLTQLTLGRYVVQIWSRGGHVPLIIEGNETLVLHRVARECENMLLCEYESGCSYPNSHILIRTAD